jgi:metallophosphoesterase superfamily enzyme
MQLNCCDQTLFLHSARVIYWAEQRTLLAADIHIGKEQVFGRTGIGIPGGLSETTLEQLMHLVDLSGAERLFILGDFVHDVPATSESWQSLLREQLDQRSELNLSVVAGNHDKPGTSQRMDQRIDWFNNPVAEPPFVFAHEPITLERGIERGVEHGAEQNDERAREHGYVLCGHIHPVYRIGTRREKIRAPVFWFQQSLAVLPAFGLFTGGYAIERNDGDRLFMTGPDCVVEV